MANNLRPRLSIPERNLVETPMASLPEPLSPSPAAAADVLVTKAGPGTIMEGLACGLPILLSGFLPGQETGNVTFVEQSGVGVLCEKPADIARTLGEWLSPGNDTITRFSARARELARPGAALDIASILDDILAARSA